jgi:hypothetical protein
MSTAHLPKPIRNGNGQREIGCTCGQWSRAWPGERMALSAHAKHVRETQENQP